MEFVVPLADSSAFFPISVRFMATDTFSDLKVCLYFYVSCGCIVVLFEKEFQNDLVETDTLTTFFDCSLQVTNIIPLKGGNPPKFAQRTQLITDNYQVV